MQVRMKQQLSRQPARRGPRVLRRASTVRGVSAPSVRSLRSSYAFSHQQGFGDLITTGSMMSVRPRPPSARIRGPIPRYVQQSASFDYDEVDKKARHRRRQRRADHTVRYSLHFTAQYPSMFICWYNIVITVQCKRCSRSTRMKHEALMVNH